MARALEEKHRLVAEYYHLPFDDELNPPPATPVKRKREGKPPLPRPKVQVAQAAKDADEDLKRNTT